MGVADGSENRTPERTEMIRQANERIAALHAEYFEGANP